MTEFEKKFWIKYFPGPGLTRAEVKTYVELCCPKR